MTKQRVFILVGLALLGACTALLFVRTSDRNGPVKPTKAADALPILLFAPFSGDFAGYGKAAELGARAAIEEVNSKGGALGRPLHLTSYELTGNEDLSPESLAKDKPALILVAAPDTLARPVLRASAEAKVPAFYLVDGPCKTQNGAAKVSPFLWGAGLSWQTTVEPFLVFLNDKFVRPEGEFAVYFISGSEHESSKLNAFSRSLSEGLAFKTVDSQEFDTRLADYFSPLRNVLSRTPDLLFISNPGASGNLMLQQAAKLRLSNDMAIAGLNTFQPELLRSLGPITDGAFTVGSYTAGLELPENKSFTESLRQIAKDPALVPTSTTAAAYNVVRLASAGFTKAASVDALRFAEALPGIELSLPNGKLSFSAENHLLTQPILVLQLKGGDTQLLENLGQAVHPKLDGCEL